MNSEKIMARWEQRATNEVLAALGLESLALRNSLPELLSQIADALSTTIDRTEARARDDRAESLRTGRKHGHERASSANYTMDQMIFEYHILRQVIFDVMDEEKPLSPTERETIVCVIEQAVNDAATQFSDTLRGINERLASTVTHDLKGPISSTKISAQMLLRRANDATYCAQIGNRISKNMDRLDSMLNDLLDAGMMRAGEKIKLRLEDCDLDVLLRELVDEFNDLHGNRFKLISDGSTLGHWDRNGIRRVVENLASNAEKYGSTDTPITIRLRRNERGVTVSVHNEGDPIPSEEQPILFQQFRRSQAAQKKQGWGLGLTVVKALTEAHGGKVRIESGPGRGTLFVVALPRDARQTERVHV